MVFILMILCCSGVGSEVKGMRSEPTKAKDKVVGRGISQIFGYVYHNFLYEC